VCLFIINSTRTENVYYLWPLSTKIISSLKSILCLICTGKLEVPNFQLEFFSRTDLIAFTIASSNRCRNVTGGVGTHLSEILLLSSKRQCLGATFRFSRFTSKLQGSPSVLSPSTLLQFSSPFISENLMSSQT
jgi:hypothetical protein